MDRLKSLDVFARVATLGSLAAAARDTGLSPAMVGNHVRALEAWFAKPLLVRTTRRQALTDAGREVLAEARSIQAGLDALERIRERGDEPSGILRVAAPLGIGRHHVAPLLRTLANRHPRLEIELRLSDFAEDLVTSGVDLAVRNGPLTGNESSLVARAAARQFLLLAAAPAYLEKAGRLWTLGDLMSHRAVRYSRHGRPRPWLFPNGDDLLQYDPPTAFMADEIDTLRDAACEGLGICWLPDWLLAECFAEGTLERVLPEAQMLVIDTYIVRPALQHPPGKVLLAADFLAKGLGRSMML
jgi:DNA-binding transcriptional LysR family regulator